MKTQSEIDLDTAQAMCDHGSEKYVLAGERTDQEKKTLAAMAMAQHGGSGMKKLAEAYFALGSEFQDRLHAAFAPEFCRYYTDFVKEDA